MSGTCWRQYGGSCPPWVSTPLFSLTKHFVRSWYTWRTTYPYNSRQVWYARSCVAAAWRYKLNRQEGHWTNACRSIGGHWHQECHAVGSGRTCINRDTFHWLGEGWSCGLSPTLPPEVCLRGMTYEDRTPQDEQRWRPTTISVQPTDPTTAPALLRALVDCVAIFLFFPLPCPFYYFPPLSITFYYFLFLLLSITFSYYIANSTTGWIPFSRGMQHGDSNSLNHSTS